MAKKNILIGVTGSVATIKLDELLNSLTAHFPEASLKIVATEKAMHFINNDLFTKYKFLQDKDEWTLWSKRGDPVLHIELRKWADIMIVAPMDANTLAKAANGVSDNLLTCILRAWDLSKPLLVCPAMNTAMWIHPVTNEHISRLLSFGYRVIDPVEKELVCGDVGFGAMAHIEVITKAIDKLV